MHAQVVVLLDGKAVTGFSFEDSVFKTTCASSPIGPGAHHHCQAFYLRACRSADHNTFAWRAGAQGRGCLSLQMATSVSHPMHLHVHAKQVSMRDEG